MIPGWMKEVDAGPYKNYSVKAGRKSFISKTLAGIFAFFRETLTSESFARKNGLLQSFDPRVKLLSALALVIATTMIRDLRVLLVVYALILILSAASKINILFFIERVWLFIPIFTGIIVLPVIFNIVTPGDNLLNIVTFGPGANSGPVALPESLYITTQGLMTALTFTVRVATCVSAIVLLFLTTPQEALFKSFRALGVPKVYVLTLDMTYRYIFIFTDIIQDMFTARRSRTIRTAGRFAEQQWVTGRIGYTLIKTLDMSDKVHKAMMSRGFTGDVKILHDYRLRARDYTGLVCALSFSVLLILISRDIIRI